MFRDFICLDIDRVQSIIAQLQQGLLESAIQGKTEETKGKATAAMNLLSLLLPVNVSGSVEHGRGTNISESRVLHDYAFEAARLSLEDEGLLQERDDLEWGEVPDRGFVLVRGAAQILDYESLRHIAENFNELDDFFNSEDSQAERKKRHKANKEFRESSVLFEAFFKDAIRVKVTNAEGCAFIGPMSREHLREDIRDLIYKHDSRPKGEWTMLAEISRIPLPGESSEDSIQQQLAHQVTQQLTVEDSSISAQIEQVITLFNAFQEFIGSASFPDVAVSPIAVYREINPR